MTTILQQGFEAQAAGLVDFGYHDVTAAMVEEAHGRWKKREAPQGIIDMFCVKSFNGRPEIFGEQDPQT